MKFLVFPIFLLTASLSTAQNSITPERAKDYVGKEVTICGNVLSTHISKSGTDFLNFGAAYPNEVFSIVVFTKSTSADKLHSLMNSDNNSSLTPELDSVVILLENDGSYGSDEILVPTLIYLKNYSEAATILNKLPDTSQDQKDFYTYYNILIKTGIQKNSIFQLNDEDYASIKSIADGDSTEISGAAQTFLSLTKNLNYPFIPENADDSSFDQNRIINNTSIANANLKVYPNPAMGSFTFEYQIGQKYSDARIALFDILGNQIDKLIISQQQGSVNYNAIQLLKGIYLCKLIVNGVTQQVLKLSIL